MDQEFKEITVRLPDGYDAYARLWAPHHIERAVLYHHGIQSHCGWYEESARRLMRNGAAVLQVDRRGSGQNRTARGHADSAEQLVDDSRAARDELFRQSGFDHYHLLGVSWGGKLCVAAYANEPMGICSMTLVTPGLFPKVGVSRSEMAKIGFAMLYEPRRLFSIPLNDPEMFTRTAQFQEFFHRDEPTLRECSAGFYLASRRMDRMIARLPQAKPLRIHLFVAGDERIIDNEKMLAFFRGLNWPDIKITTYPDARHSLEFENEREDYFGELVRFIGSSGEEGANA